jgi:hydroxyacylglutathione hydrolase
MGARPHPAGRAGRQHSWHSDNVGGNALLQAMGAGIAASTADAQAIARRDPGCCVAEYLDQPVAPYTVDEALGDGQLLRLGDVDWEVLHTPGHAPGHLSLWQPEERLLMVGDALSDYDVGWINRALDGPDAAATALASLRRLAALDARVLLPSHGPIPHRHRRGVRQRAAPRAAPRRRPAGMVWHGIRRIFGFALMIRDGIAVDEVEPYLHARAWLTDAARLLDTSPEVLAAELIDTMLRSNAIVLRDKRLHATAEHALVAPETLRIPFPRAWPATTECRHV